MLGNHYAKWYPQRGIDKWSAKIAAVLRETENVEKWNRKSVKCIYAAGLKSVTYRVSVESVRIIAERACMMSKLWFHKASSVDEICLNFVEKVFQCQKKLFDDWSEKNYFIDISV